MIWKVRLQGTFNVFLLYVSISCPPVSAFGYRHSCRGRRIPTLSSSAGDDDDTADCPKRFYLDVSVAGENVGKLEFFIPKPRSVFPMHTENILKLADGSSTGLDPRLSYKNCEFQYSPQFIEGFPQYRWAHNLPGRGRNAVGRAEERIVDVECLQATTYRLYGGIYYGLEYSTIPEDNAGILTIPMTGPTRGSSGLSIVRVDDSPKEWRERLLLNSAVLGWLEPQSASALQGFQQTNGPPTVVDCGVL